MKTKGSFKSIYNCPHCHVAKEISQNECPCCHNRHSFLDDLIAVVSESSSILESRNKINQKFNTNLSRQKVTKIIKSIKMDISHFKGGRGRFFYTKENTLVENSSVNPQILKALVLREKVLDYKCVECGNTGEYNGKKLVLQLDHINGVSNDHRVTNLRFLCPNCHTQTPTYCGKNRPSSN